VLSANSAIYAKIGYSHADVNLSSGSSNVSITSYTDNVEGWTYGIGSKNMLTNNLYLTIEGSLTDYDTISVATSAADSGVASSATGNPKVIQAKIGLGYRF
jgi:opacity protein-like surface antigen